MDITVFLGAPGSGKGTQAKILAGKGFKHFSTGDMLRAAIAAGTDTGVKAKKFIDAGELVPDAVMIELIERTLEALPDTARIILDGFPRTEAQAEALDGNPNTEVNRAVFFEMPEDLLVERLTGRRICSQCGQPYHVKFMPPKKAGICDLCSSALLQRPDDQESVVKRRLEVYTKQTQPLLDFFGDRHKLKPVQADASIDKLQADLNRILK